ncbi:MAG TPA: ABC transporter permease [Bryobacteraceae bacterium]|jgi:putative ABC transport system permease protein
MFARIKDWASRVGMFFRTRKIDADARGLPLLDTLLQDIRYASRSLKKFSGFTTAAVLTLAIGIGANTAIFSIVDEALFRPLDFPRPDELVDIFTFDKASQKFLSSSFPDYQDLRARVTTFQALSAFVRIPANVFWNGRNQELPIEAVTGNFFSMLGLSPVAGRTFRDEDDSLASQPVAMISEGIGDASSIGQTILLEEKPFTIIGIVPKRYHGTNLNWGAPPKVWIPLQATALVRPRFRTIGFFEHRSMRSLLVTGRLKPGIRLPQAQAEVRAIATGIAREAPKDNRNISENVFSASRAKFWPAYRASVTRSLAVFAGASGLVLLLTCANLSNLLLSRGLARQREFAIRMAIGAGRKRLVRQLLTESFLLSLPSCLVALAIAHSLGRILAHFPNALGLPLALDGGIENRVLFFCIALSIVTTVLFGLMPAFETTRPDVLPALKESGRTLSGGGRHHLRNLLMAVQVAFSMILLVGAGLFGLSVMRGWSMDPGFRLGGLWTVGFSIPPPESASTERLRRSQYDLARRLRKLPVVESVTLGSDLPMAPFYFVTQIHTPNVVLSADQQTVGLEFFHTMGIALLRGRDFDAHDNSTAPKVAIVNEKLAGRLWSGRNPLGQILTAEDTAMRVVGVVRDVKYGSVWEEPKPFLYVADAQSNRAASYLILRLKGHAAAFASIVTREWSRLMPRSPLADFQSGDELLDVALAPQRVATGVFGAFALMSVVLVSVGLYSVMAYAVARRTREIGIRLALGAKPAIVVRQVLGNVLAVAAVGVAVGAGVSVLLGGFVASQIKGVSVHDAAMFALSAALLGVVAFCAGVIPARRMVRIDPQQALRSE